jgi:hypothetical protein
MRGGHAERAEQPLACEPRQSCSRDPADKRGREHIPGIGVGERGPRGKVELTLAGDQVHCPVLADPEHRDSGELAEREVVAQARGVGQALPQRDWPGQGKLRQAGTDVAVQIDQSVPGEQQHACRGHVLADRGNVERGLLGDWHAVLGYRAAGRR